MRTKEESNIIDHLNKSIIQLRQISNLESNVFIIKMISRISAIIDLLNGTEKPKLKTKSNVVYQSSTELDSWFKDKQFKKLFGNAGSSSSSNASRSNSLGQKNNKKS
jgi:hypothetical protein